MGYWVMQRRIEGVRPTLRLSRGSVVIGLDPSLVLAADLQGRPWRLIEGPETVRWNLLGGGLTVTRAGAPQQGRSYRRFGSEEGIARWLRTRERLAPLLARRVRPDRLRWQPGADRDASPAALESLQRVLNRLAARDGEQMRHDAAEAARIYSPIGILPPDRYMALVVQLTRGCSFNTCTFCTFYRDQVFGIKEPEQLRRHMERIDAFLGQGRGLRREIFLGDANALVVPMSRLEPLVAEVAAHYHRRLEAGEGMHAFLDGFSGTRKQVADYGRLRALGLRRVSVGLESGHDPLLAWLRKPGDARQAASAIATMKQAGLSVSVIILLGAGGTRYDQGHRHDTAALLADLPLDAGDLIYFSRYTEQPGAPYGVIARDEGVVALDGTGMRRQQEAITAALRSHHRGGPRTAVYDIREFTY